MLTPMCWRFPIWLILFRWVETTNQERIVFQSHHWNPGTIRIETPKLQSDARRRKRKPLHARCYVIEASWKVAHMYIYILHVGGVKITVFICLFPLGVWESQEFENKKHKKTWCLPCVHPKMDECKCKPERMQWINCTPGFNLVS